MKLSSLWRYSEIWYSGYAFQGMVVFGLGGILMPIVVDRGGNAAKAGTVIAFFYIGQLLAPVVGGITDRTGRHKLFYLLGYVLLAIGLGLFPLTNLIWFWMALAFIQGVGSGTSNTVAAMFIVEYKPKPEWDNRIGWLQTYYGVGQCLGLVLVSYLQSRPEVGLVVAAVLMLPGIFLGSKGLPPSEAHQKPHKVELSRRSHRPARFFPSMLNRYEAEISKGLKNIYREWFSAFGLYITGWFFVMLATWLLGVLFPLVMKNALGISYRLSSLYYAVGAALGIFVYPASGALGKKIGDGWVVTIGTLMSLVSLAGMAVFSYVHTPLNVWLVPVIYILIPIAWSPLIVGGTAWTAQLTTIAEGEALGSFNAASAISSIIAALTAGQLAHNLGYGMVLVVATASSLVSLFCFFPLLFRKEKKS